MKKYIITLMFLFSLPSFAACPINGGEAVCSLPGFREQVSPVFKETNTLGSFNSNQPSGQLQPLSRTDPINQMREPNNNLNYNSGCQFGVCLQNPNESRLPVNSGID